MLRWVCVCVWGKSPCIEGGLRDKVPKFRATAAFSVIIPTQKSRFPKGSPSLDCKVVLKDWFLSTTAASQRVTLDCYSFINVTVE